MRNSRANVSWRLPHCRILLRFDPCNVIGMHAIAEIGIARHTAWLETVDRLELRCPNELARARVPIPDPYARLQLSQAKPLLAFTEPLFRRLALSKQRP